MKTRLKELVQCTCGSDLDFELNRCDTCGTIFTWVNDEAIVFDEVYSPDEVKPKPFTFSEKQLKKDGNWRLQNFKLAAEWIASTDPSETVLDLGSGRLINSEILKNYEVIYVDGARFDGVNLICDFSSRIPLRSESISTILCSNVFEHLPEPQTCMNEIERILKPGGRCLILVPFIIKLHSEPFDFHRYTKYAIARYCRQAGFVDVKIQEVGGNSNILGTVLKIAISESDHPIKTLILRVQQLAWKITRKLFGDDKPSSTFPQGYAVFLKKQ